MYTHFYITMIMLYVSFYPAFSLTIMFWTFSQVISIFFKNIIFRRLHSITLCRCNNYFLFKYLGHLQVFSFTKNIERNIFLYKICLHFLLLPSKKISEMKLLYPKVWILLKVLICAANCSSESLTQCVLPPVEREFPAQSNLASQRH